MTETGIVKEIKENQIVIAIDKLKKSEACFGCMKTECKNRDCIITAGNTGELPLRAGQTVEIQTQNTSLLRQSLMAFLPPLLSFFAGYTLIRLLFPNAGEGAFAGMGAVFLFAAAFIVYRARKKRPPEEVYTVTRVIGETGNGE